MKDQVRCPCCDSVFMVEITGIKISRAEVVLDKTKEKAKKVLEEGSKQTYEKEPITPKDMC